MSVCTFCMLSIGFLFNLSQDDQTTLTLNVLLSCMFAYCVAFGGYGITFAYMNEIGQPFQVALGMCTCWTYKAIVSKMLLTAVSE